MLAITDSPLARSTEVIRLIGIYGPIKLRDIEAHVSFSRSTLQRICAQLEALNWARRRVSDKAYVLTYAIDDFFASAQFSAPEVDQVQPVLSMVKAEGFYDITFSIFASKTRFADVDSTKPPVEWTTEHSLIFSNAAISAQSEMSEQEQKTLIAKATTQANPEERTELRMGKYHQEVRKARMRGYVLDPTLPSISFSWRAETGAICTLTVEPAAATRTARQEFLKYHRQILEKFSIICDDHFRTNLVAARDQRAYG
jgi:DNA-binding IclR family transcriptional regulator